MLLFLKFYYELKKRANWISILSVIVSLFCFELLAQGDSSDSKEVELCSHVFLLAPIDPEFSQTELLWLCGDPNNAAYSSIPLYQAAVHARAFLQQRAYGAAKVEIQGTRLLIRPGQIQSIESIGVDWGDSKPNELAFLEEYKGSPLNPSTLDRVESNVKRFLREDGYPCPRVSSEVYGRELRVIAWHGERRRFGQIDMDSVEGLYPEAFFRFRPFDEDTFYSPWYLELYEKRILRNEVVQGTYFRNECDANNQPQTIRQSFLSGPPRTMRFGLGITTESGPLTQLVWSHHRYGQMASLLRVGLNLSYREQSLLSEADIFLWPKRPRLSLPARWRLARTKSKDFTQIENEFFVGLKRTWDTEDDLWTLGVGPAFLTEWYSERGARGFKRESALSLKTYFEKKTHDFEYFDFHPQEGSRLNFSVEYRDANFGSVVKAARVETSYRFLKPLGACGRGRCVFAVRGQVQNLWAPTHDLAVLPPSLKSYLGAYDQLRGFEPQSLPNNGGLGALSTWATGVEFRGEALVSKAFEPYVFWDTGMAGEGLMDYESPRYESLGLGLRWISPIGMVQGYVSRSQASEFYFYAALGGEF